MWFYTRQGNRRNRPAFTVTVLYGGNVNIIGILFGVLIIGIIANGLNLLGINPNYQIIAKGLLILFALIMDRFSVKSRIIKSDF